MQKLEKLGHIKFDIGTNRIVDGGIERDFYSQDKGTATLKFELLENGQNKELSSYNNVKAKVILKTADGSIFVNDAVIEDAYDGIISYTLTDDQLLREGAARGELFIDSDEKRIVALNFEFNIKLSLVDMSNSKEPVKIETLREYVETYIDSHKDEFKGNKGEPGPVGLQGLKGENGLTGPIGPIGPKGADGPQGIQGIQGPKGDKGDTGMQGVPGPIGPKGDKGDKGDTGAVGPIGPIGLTGPTGPKGDTGPQGPQGLKGDTGTGLKILDTFTKTTQLPSTGSSGDAYFVNENLYVWSPSNNAFVDKGALKGAQGEQGIQGPMGPQGPKGDAGLTGPQGQQGVQGVPGPKGDNGANGNDGKSAYQIWLDKGNTGTEQDFLNSLKNPGAHTHVIADITNLQSTLDGKASTSHNHDTVYASKTHTHAISDITNLQNTLDGKASTSHTHTSSQITDFSTEMNKKANTIHNHAIGDVTGLQSALDSKASNSHTHTASQILMSDSTTVQQKIDSLSTSGGNSSVTAPTWFNAVLSNGFTGSVKYCKDNFNIVTVNVDVTVGSATVLNTVVASLPQGYLPPMAYLPDLFYNSSVGVADAFFNVGNVFNGVTIAKSLQQGHNIRGQFMYRV